MLPSQYPILIRCASKTIPKYLSGEVDYVASLTKQKAAEILRQAIRAGLPIVANRAQAPRPEGYSASDYESEDPQRRRQRAAHAKAVRQSPPRR